MLKWIELNWTSQIRDKTQSNIVSFNIRMDFNSDILKSLADYNLNARPVFDYELYNSFIQQYDTWGLEFCKHSHISISNKVLWSISIQIIRPTAYVILTTSFSACGEWKYSLEILIGSVANKLTFPPLISLFYSIFAPYHDYLAINSSYPVILTLYPLRRGVQVDLMRTMSLANF